MSLFCMLLLQKSYFTLYNSAKGDLRLAHTSDTMLAARDASGKEWQFHFLLSLQSLSWAERRLYTRSLKQLSPFYIKSYISMTVRFFRHHRNKVKFHEYLRGLWVDHTHTAPPGSSTWLCCQCNKQRVSSSVIIDHSISLLYNHPWRYMPTCYNYIHHIQVKGEVRTRIQNAAAFFSVC